MSHTYWFSPSVLLVRRHGGAYRGFDLRIRRRGMLYRVRSAFVSCPAAVPMRYRLFGVTSAQVSFYLWNYHEDHFRVKSMVCPLFITVPHIVSRTCVS